MENSTMESVKSEGLQTRGKIDEFVSRGKPLLGGSALIEEGVEIGPSEVEVAYTLLEQIAPIDKDNFQVHEHVRLTGKFARKMAEQLDLNPDELEVAGLLHDIGRFVTHRYFRNDLLGDLLLRKLGFKKSFLAKMPSFRGYVGPKTYKSIEDLPIEQRIIDIADLCAKRKDDGDIRTFTEVVEYHRSSRSRYEDLIGLAAVWPTEKYAFRHMLPDEQGGERGIIERSADIYERVKDWLDKQRVDVEKIRQEILEEESSSRTQAIIFDVGGVLIPYSAQQVKQDFTESLGLDNEAIERVQTPLVLLLRVGQISEDEFWQKLAEQTGKPLPGNYRQLWTKSLATTLDPKIKDTLQKLKSRGYRLAVLSDTIPPHQRALKRGSVYKDFSTVVTSPEIGVTKNSLAAYYIAALRLRLPPQACVLIDDNPKFVEMAQETKMQAIYFQSADQLEQELQGSKIL